MPAESFGGLSTAVIDSLVINLPACSSDFITSGLLLGSSPHLLLPPVLSFLLA